MEKTVALSDKESFDINQLNDILKAALPTATPIIAITRFAGGYSNLTYQLSTADQIFVMRMAPPGANIQSAHDMEREYKVLSLLKPFFNKVKTSALPSTTIISSESSTAGPQESLSFPYSVISITLTD
jgi:aminoglycoside phosphotransferase (APT) family kinase protein